MKKIKTQNSYVLALSLLTCRNEMIPHVFSVRLRDTGRELLCASVSIPEM